MYIPPYEALLRRLGATPADVEKAGQVALPLSLFKLLVQLSLEGCDFDEEAYLEANPDVRKAIRRGDIESGLHHYVGYGYFEGRRGGVVVDEKWYLAQYPDVARGMKSGQVGSAAEHFHSIGAGEGRAPSEDQQDVAEQWKNTFLISKV